MVCHFCKKSTHVTEYCPDFPTLRSRYSEIWKWGQRNCLCPNLSNLYIRNGSKLCKCETVCTVCFQYHHFVLCPKKDFNHPLNPILMPEPLLLFSHHSPFAKRFFELCNPCDQFKLQKCCKYFKNLKSVPLKLHSNYNSGDYYSPINAVLNHKGAIVNIKNIAVLALIFECFFNFQEIRLEKCFITKEDLKLLSKSDPNTIEIDCCEFDVSVELKDILDSFPYAYKINFTFLWEFPKNFILALLNAKRYVNYKTITAYSIGYAYLIVNDLIKFFEQNPDTQLNITAKVVGHFEFTNQLKNHHRFVEVDGNTSYNLCLYYHDPTLKYYFKYHILS